MTVECYQSRASEIRNKLARILADEADADFNARGQSYHWLVAADVRITDWLRYPREVKSEADRVCEEYRQNEEDIRLARQDRGEQRRVVFERQKDQELQKAKEADEIPPDGFAYVYVKDGANGKLFRLTLPSASVKQVDGKVMH